MILSKDQDLTYFIGIIDTLTNYNFIKKTEYVTKSIFQGSKISCKPPNIYRDRFIAFMNQIIEGVFEINSMTLLPGRKK